MMKKMTKQKRNNQMIFFILKNFLSDVKIIKKNFFKEKE